MELHSPVKLIQRSKGRSSVAAAAYRSGTCLKDERTGEVHDFRKKQGVEFEALMFPEGTPEKITDRKELWNAAEKRENRKNSQTARDIEISIPAEFSPEQRKEAGLLIGNFLVERYNTAVDLCWHEPGKKGDERNYHLHVLMTTRRFENGDWSKTKDRILDDRFGQGREEITRIRQGIADTMNNIAARDNVPVYVEHLSFEERGIDREPLKAMSKDAIEMERKGVKTDIGNKNREIQKRNIEREQLYKEQEAVSMEIKRAELEAKGEKVSQTASETPQNSPQTQGSSFYKGFYAETQKRRQNLLNLFKQEYGEQEARTKSELGQLGVEVVLEQKATLCV